MSDKRIVRGTTPTIRYKANQVDVSDVSEAYLTFLQFGKKKFEKDISTAAVDSTEGTIAWKLTQAETLSLSDETDAEIHCKVKLDDGTVFEATQATVTVGKTGKNEVI